MTFKLNERYPNRAKSPTSEFPRGSAKNRTAPNSADGTYLEEDLLNDMRGFPEKLLNVAKITANGSVDNGINSQVYDAFVKIVSDMITERTVKLFAMAVGSSDEIQATMPRSIALVDGLEVFVRCNFANQTVNPTLNVNAMGAKAIVKGTNDPLVVGDIKGAGYIARFMFDTRFDRWVLTNPAKGVSVESGIPVGTIAFMAKGGDVDGWLLVDDKEHDRSAYPRLIEQCPQFIRSGSIPSTFRLTDLRGYFLRGLDLGRGVDVGRGFATIQGDAIRNIKGQVGSIRPNWGGASPTGVFYENGYGEDGGRNPKGTAGLAMDASREVPTANENRPKNIALPLYIKF